MIDLPQRISLIHLADGTTVRASIVELTRDLAQDQIDGSWWKLPDVQSERRKLENDHPWKWAKRIGELRNDRWHEAVAVQTDDDQVQGAILYWFNTLSFIEKHQGAVFVEALATAPRNRQWLAGSAQYRGVGEALLLRAVIHSYLLGLGGRVNLLAFDDLRLVSFYRNRGFSPVGIEDDLLKFELGTDAAAAWLREEGYDV